MRAYLYRNRVRSPKWSATILRADQRPDGRGLGRSFTEEIQTKINITRNGKGRGHLLIRVHRLPSRSGFRIERFRSNSICFGAPQRIVQKRSLDGGNPRLISGHSDRNS